MDGFKAALSKYAQFSGRSRRREFWGFAITYWVINTVFWILTLIAIAANSDNSLGAFGVLVLIVWVLFGLALLIPWLALSWRRYQDIGTHGAVSIVGWFIPLVTFIVGFIPGTVGDNPYGPDPKA